MPRKKITIRCEDCGRVVETHTEGVRFKEFYKCTHFYGDAGLYRRIGYYPICKNCVRKSSSDEYGNIILSKFKEDILKKKFNKPFLKDKWEDAVLSKRDTIGHYFTLLGNRKYSELQWKDSDDFKEQINKDEEVKEDTKKQKISNRNDGYDIEKLKEKYGYGYPDDEYILFEKKYQELYPSFTLVTTMHIECLKEYCVNKVKEGLAKAKGDFKEAKEWANMAKDVANSGKLNPNQMSKADLTNGMDTFSQLVRMVEEHPKGELVGLLPKFIEKPKDKVDVTLWLYINYVRDLKGLPACEYKDIYDFYEKRRDDYESEMLDKQMLEVEDKQE